jgi:hypothetical protein
LLIESLCCCTIHALFIFLLLPFLSNLKGIPFAELPSYLTRGVACFLNVGGNMKGEYCFSYHIQVVNKWSFSCYIISNQWLIREKSVVLILYNFKYMVDWRKRDVHEIFHKWILSISTFLFWYDLYYQGMHGINVLHFAIYVKLKTLVASSLEHDYLWSMMQDPLHPLTKFISVSQSFVNIKWYFAAGPW